MDTIEDKLGDSMEKVRIDLLGGVRTTRLCFVVYRISP